MSFLVTVSPALFLLYWLARSSFFCTLRSMIWVSAGLGVLVVMPAAFVSKVLTQVRSTYFETGQPWLDAVTESFLGAGAIEELSKLGALLWLLHRHALHQRPLELVGCALAIGLGVGAIENWGYVAFDLNDQYDFRLLSLLVHPMLTGIAATYLALGEIMQKRRWRYRMLAILIPILLHGAINLPGRALEWDIDFPLAGPFSQAMVSVVYTVFLILLSKIKGSFIGGSINVDSSRYATDWTAAGQIAAGSFGLLYVLKKAFPLGVLGYHAFLSLDDQRLELVLPVELFGLVSTTETQLLMFLGAAMAVAFLLSALFLLLLRQAWRRLFVLPSPEA